MFFKVAALLVDLGQFIGKIVPCLWTGVGESTFSELGRESWLDVVGGRS